MSIPRHKNKTSGHGRNVSFSTHYRTLQWNDIVCRPCIVQGTELWRDTITIHAVNNTDTGHI